jgi:hypothetical protein
VKSIRLVLLVLGLMTAGVAIAPNAGASAAQTETTQPSTVPPGATAIDRNFWFTGATISSASDPTPRSLNDYQTAVFVQSWLPTAIFSTPEKQDPPSTLPVYRVDIMGSWGGDQPQAGNQTVYYASDGTTGWMSYPQGQEVTSTPSATPPPPSNWFVVPQRTVDAFNGKGTLVDTAGTAEANTPRTRATSDGSGSGSSSRSWVAYALVIGAAIVIIGGGVMFFRRRRSPDDLAPAD